MLGAIKMENGAQNGLRTNHDRELKVNSINGIGMVKREPSPNKFSKSSGAAILNGGYDTPMDADAPNPQAQAASNAPDQDSKINNLPPEIAHITQNFIPLPLILNRLAQKSHNDLQTKIEELAKIPIHGGATNGAIGTAEDNSDENQNKKANLLHFIQDMHGRWVKALVISEWSRKAGQVSRLIDLNVHISEQVTKYDMGLDFMGRIKRDLYGARLPDPDIRTALQILSTGQAPWMPEFGYIDPPPLTVAEQMKWISELNTLLSIRLNLEDHDKIPYQFRDYTIDSGRVTFKVKGEFEVDLTIADEDFEKQFWFINFRFNFSPAPKELPEALMAFVEMKVNEVLGSDGLRGCYEFLHEFVLTHKINELRRQALVLSRGRWIENVKVERLNRALSIQYWTNRFLASDLKPVKSWIIVGINSGKTPPRNSSPGTRPTSYLTLRWFRDGKEIKDVDALVDSEEISAEVLLKRIIARHVEHILSSMYAKLLSKPRFEKRQASISLSINSEEPSDSTLVIQLTHSQNLTMRLNTTNGLFNMQPAARSLISRGEVFLNQRCKNPIEDGVMQIENIRWQSEFDEVIRRGTGSGWHMSRRPVNPDEVKRLHPSREHYQALWLKREGWGPAWYLVVCLSLAGDTWWLVEVMDDAPPTEGKGNPPKPRTKALNTQANVRKSVMVEQPTARIKTYNFLPITSANPELSVTFFTDLSALTTGMIAQITDITTLRKNKIPYATKRADNPYLSPRLKIPGLYIRLAAILPPQSNERKLKQPRGSWAEEFVQIVFRGVRGAAASSNKRLEVSADVKIVVNDKSKFALIKGNVDHDVIYQPRTGQFRLQLRTEIGKSFIESLATRLKAIDRLVEFVAAMSSRANTVKCESVTLRKVVFTYGTLEQAAAGGQQNQPRWRVVLDLAGSEKVKITLEKGNPHIRVQDMLERLVNSPVGFEQLPYWLQVTLPLHRGLDSIEDSWAETTANNQGELQILPRALDWLTVHFELPASPNRPSRTLCLSFRLKSRRGQLWWNMERYLRPEDAPKKEDDAFDAALQPVFDSRGDGWQGHGKSAVAHPHGSSIEGLLAKVSDVVKALATRGSPRAPVGSQGAAIVLD